MTTIHPNCVEDNSQLASQISTKTKRWKCAVISLMAVFLACALVVCLVAVIIYSPLVSGGDNTESSASTAGHNMLLSRIQQLEETNTVKESQMASMQNLIQTSTLAQNNLRQDLDRLRTVNLYEGCIQQTGICTMPTLSTTSYRTCYTGSVSINPEVSL